MSADISSIRIERLNNLMRQLILYPNMPRNELMRKLEIDNVRTLQRDIKYLRDLYNADIEYDFRMRAYKCKNHGSFYVNLKLDLDEITSLSSGIQMTKHFLPHLAPACDRLWCKIEKLLSRELIAHGKSLGQSAEVAAPVAKMDTEIFSTLISAAHNHNAVSILYKSPYGDTEPRRHELSPWKFYFQEYAWYMLAWNHFFKKEGVWRISRIKAVDMSAGEYMPCSCEADFENIISSVWFAWSKDLRYEVHLKILPPLAESISEIMWHPTQTIEEMNDGSVLLKAKVSEIEPIEWWVEKNRKYVSFIKKDEF